MNNNFSLANQLRIIAKVVLKVGANGTASRLKSIADSVERLKQLKGACEALTHPDGKIYPQIAKGPKLKELNKALEATRKDPVMQGKTAQVKHTSDGKEEDGS